MRRCAVIYDTGSGNKNDGGRASDVGSLSLVIIRFT